MATTVGTVSGFDQEQRTWEVYCEVLSHFFSTNDVTDEDKKTAVLLSSMGPSKYSLMRNLLLLEKPSGKTFGELIMLLQNHFKPALSETEECFKFNS